MSIWPLKRLWRAIGSAQAYIFFLAKVFLKQRTTLGNTFFFHKLLKKVWEKLFRLSFLTDLENPAIVFQHHVVRCIISHIVMQKREEKRQSNPKAVCDRLNWEPTFSWMNECFLGASNHHLSFKTEKHRNSLLSYSVLASFSLCSFETIDIRYEQKKKTHSPLLFGEDQCQSILLNSCQPELYL